MDSLLCDEVWLTDNSKLDNRRNVNGCFFYTAKEDCKQAFEICLQKELSYMPESAYQHHLQSHGLCLARFRVMLWLVKSQSRLNLSCQSVFNAANYFDRFVSSQQCKGWKYWMFELLAIACLSVASKFGETAHPPFHEIQMEGLDHSFQSNLIRWMELTLLKTLGWQLGSVTAYSYMELLMCNFIDTLTSFLLGKLTTRVSEMLLGSLSDSQLLEFRPCTIAISAVKCVINELELPSSNFHLAYINTLIPGDQKDDIIECHKILEGKQAYKLFPNSMDTRRYCICPASPVTVLKREQVEECGCQGELSLFKMPNLKSSNMKRKKREID